MRAVTRNKNLPLKYTSVLYLGVCSGRSNQENIVFYHELVVAAMIKKIFRTFPCKKKTTSTKK